MGRMTLEEAIKHANKIAVQMELDNCKECSENHKQLAEWLEELKSYKGLEEQGLLVRIPVKIGDALYCIDNGFVEKFVVSSYKIKIYRQNRIEIGFEDASGFALCTFAGELDEGYFLTRKEAEKKLKEIQNDKT